MIKVNKMQKTSVNNMVIPANIKKKPSNNSGINSLIELTAADMEKVNSLIISQTISKTDIIPKISRYLITAGGKRLRPMLTIASSILCGRKDNNHILLATSVEFMHTATLLHDDVVDDSSMRRGKISAKMLWGNEASVLVGDYILGQAFKIMVESGSLKALGTLSNAAAIIAQGEVMQLSSVKNISTSEDDYINIIESKTAALFAAATEIGGIINDRPKKECEALRSFGYNLGLAFQLADDALDYNGDAKTLGKEIGDDFNEGKITLPIILSYKKSNSEENKFWNSIMLKEERTRDDFVQAMIILQKHNCINETIEVAEHYASLAIKALDLFPDSEIKKALIESVLFSCNRNH